jgi:uncharacterized protein
MIVTNTKNHSDNAKALFSNDEAYIETFSGKRIYFLHPEPDMFDIGDIAHALANNCRWTGHCRKFYSVAEHSFWVSTLVPPEQRMAALMHDASEAYLTDVAAPIKPSLTNYYELEAGIMKAISTKFGFEQFYPFTKEIKYADTVLLSEEARQLTALQGNEWKMWETIGGRPGNIQLPLHCASPELAEKLFLKAFNDYKSGLN